jgi:hypothetical protein
LAAIIKQACPTTPYLQGIDPEETMNSNLLKTIAMRTLTVVAFALISPVILVYGSLFGIGIVSDLMQLSGAALPVVLIATPVAYLMFRRAPAPAAA